jgi:hypothetical protein
MTPALRWLPLVGVALVVSGCGGQDAHGPAASASVSKVVLRDGHDDLWTQYDERGQVVANSDAVGAVITRTAEKLVVEVRYDDIRARANPEWGVEFELDTGSGLYPSISWGEYRFVGTHRWSREVDFDVLSSEDEVGGNCRELRATPDFDADTVTVNVPGRCFKNAPWVVVKDLSATSTGGGRHNPPDYFDHLGSTGPDSRRTPHLVVPDKSRNRT